MGQLLLPLFPKETKYLTPNLGVFEKDSIVYYLHSGVPIYSHAESDLNNFRFVTSNLTLQGLCKNVDIVRLFSVSTDSVRRWKKRLDEEGEEVFFSKENRHGRSHKLLPHILERIQKSLDKGESNNSIAKREEISEGSIRYAIKQGYLKKNKTR